MCPPSQHHVEQSHCCFKSGIFVSPHGYYREKTSGGLCIISGELERAPFLALPLRKTQHIQARERDILGMSLSLFIFTQNGESHKFQPQIPCHTAASETKDHIHTPPRPLLCDLEVPYQHLWASQTASHPPCLGPLPPHPQACVEAQLH